VIGAKVLVYGDSPAVNTGLGIVCRENIQALLSAGCEVTCMGVNHHVAYVDPVEYPFPIYAAHVNREGDTLGRAAFVRLARRFRPDFVLISFDVPLAAQLIRLLRRDGQHVPVVVYCPVDRRLYPSDITQESSTASWLCYTHWGAGELRRLGLEAGTVYLGCDTHAFRPLTAEERREARGRIFGIGDDGEILVVSVGRNQWRKDPGRALLAFKAFSRLLARRARLYLHASHDAPCGAPLKLMAQDLDFDLAAGEFILAPSEYVEGISDVAVEQMRLIYGCADVVLSVSMGEGWGFSTTEAFAVGVPFVGPRNSATTELVGEAEERGWLIRCRGEQFAYGFDYHPRPVVDVSDAARRLWEATVSEEHRREREIKVARALEWVRRYTWEVHRRALVLALEGVLTAREVTEQASQGVNGP